MNGTSTVGNRARDASGATPWAIRQGRCDSTGPYSGFYLILAGVKVSRPATGALVDAGYTSMDDLPDDLHALLAIHGVGPRAVKLLRAKRGH